MFGGRVEELREFIERHSDRLPTSELIKAVNVEFGVDIGHRDTFKYHLAKHDIELPKDKLDSKIVEIAGLKQVLQLEMLRLKKAEKGLK